MSTLRGRCLCGAVRYEVEDAFQYMGYCHCSECRKFSGAAASPNAGIEAGKLRIIAGSEQLARWRKTENTVMVFCQVCGSSMFTDKVKRGMVHLRLGTLEDTPTMRPAYHAFVGSKAEWETLADDLTRYDERRPGSVHPAELATTPGA